MAFQKTVLYNYPLFSPLPNFLAFCTICFLLHQFLLNFFVLKMFLKCICLRCTTWWFVIHRHSEMITRVKLINIFPHVVTIFFLMRALEIYSHNKFPIFNAELLTIVIMLYSRSLDLFTLHNLHFVSFDYISLFPPLSTPGNPCSTLCVYIFLTALDSTYKWDHSVFPFCAWLISLSIMSFRFMHVVVNDRISFLRAE